MKIGGFQELSLIDYPDKLCAIIWTIGCNFQCPFCYNSQLVFQDTEIIKESKVLNYLRKRRGELEALSISGGEPLLYYDIYDFLKKVKELNYLIKIDTNGSFPKRLRNIINEKLVDYIAMDIKAPKEKYDQLSGIKVNISKIEESIQFIKNYAPEYEFKTTIVPNMLNKKEI